MLAGGIVYFLVQNGPLDVPAQRFNPRYLLHTIRVPATRMVFFGYLGHMWELYAMWAAIPVFLGTVYGARNLVGDALDLASLVTFLVFIAGAVASVGAGYLAERFGRTATTSVAMAISGGSALFIGFLPVDWEVIITVVALIWGASVIADSAQFSTALTELCEEAYRGTARCWRRQWAGESPSPYWESARPWASSPCSGFGPCRNPWPALLAGGDHR